MYVGRILRAKICIWVVQVKKKKKIKKIFFPSYRPVFFLAFYSKHTFFIWPYLLFQSYATLKKNQIKILSARYLEKYLRLKLGQLVGDE